MTVAQRLAFVTDVPDLSTFAWPEGTPEDLAPDAEGPPTSRIQVAKVGKFKHPRYGAFSVTKDTFDSFVANLAGGVVGDQLPGDFDHEPDLGGKTGACGWLKELHPEGDQLFATVEWNWDGAYAIREGVYRWISPTWQMNYVDDTGEKHGPTLIAFALTNRPFFSRMAAVSLSQSFSTAFAGLPDATVEDTETDPVEDPAESSDSRRRMTDFIKQIATVFSLPEDATEEQVLAAAHSALAARLPADHIAITAARVAELERSAKVPAGHTVIVATVLTELEGKAAKADRLEKDLADVKFETAFTAALGEGRVTPAEKEYFHKVAGADLDLAVDMLRDRLPVVITAARGDGGDPGPSDAPEGVDPDSFALDRKVKAFMRDKGMGMDKYPEALNAVLAQEEIR